jgi:hypothetical protein
VPQCKPSRAKGAGNARPGPNWGRIKGKSTILLLYNLPYQRGSVRTVGVLAHARTVAVRSGGGDITSMSAACARAKWGRCPRRRGGAGAAQACAAGYGPRAQQSAQALSALPNPQPAPAPSLSKHPPTRNRTLRVEESEYARLCDVCKVCVLTRPSAGNARPGPNWGRIKGKSTILLLYNLPYQRGSVRTGLWFCDEPAPTRPCWRFATRWRCHKHHIPESRR